MKRLGKSYVSESSQINLPRAPLTVLVRLLRSCWPVHKLQPTCAALRPIIQRASSLSWSTMRRMMMKMRMKSHWMTSSLRLSLLLYPWLTVSECEGYSDVTRSEERKMKNVRVGENSKHWKIRWFDDAGALKRPPTSSMPPPIKSQKSEEILRKFRERTWRFSLCRDSSPRNSCKISRKMKEKIRIFETRIRFYYLRCILRLHEWLFRSLRQKKFH